MKWPKVEVESSKLITEYKFIGGGWLPVAMCCAMLSAIFMPYFIVLVRGTLTPFLPFVSQAAGSPPQSGVFALFLFLSSLLAFVGLNLFNMAVRVQKNRLEDGEARYLVTLLNKLTLFPGHVGIFGMLTVAAYPMDFHRSSEHWMSETIIPHLIGALSLFFGGICYCILITYILSLLYPEKKLLLGVRIFLLCLIVTLAALQGYTVQEGFMEEYQSESRLSSCTIQPFDYSLTYLVSSVSEWLLLLLFVVFFLSLKEEASEFCFNMSITLKEDRPQICQPIMQEQTAKDENHNFDSTGEKRTQEEVHS